MEDIQRLTNATAKLIGMFGNPWEELTFRSLSNHGNKFTLESDRYLLCLTHLHGFGSWDLVQNSIRRSERFRFDFYLQSCTAETLGKRCELLMRSLEREMAEVERKRQAADANNASDKGSRTAIDIHKTRVVEYTPICAEENRLAAPRTQLGTYFTCLTCYHFYYYFLLSNLTITNPV